MLNSRFDSTILSGAINWARENENGAREQPSEKFMCVSGVRMILFGDLTNVDLTIAILSSVY